MSKWINIIDSKGKVWCPECALLVFAGIYADDATIENIEAFEENVKAGNESDRYGQPLRDASTVKHNYTFCSKCHFVLDREHFINEREKQ